MTIEQFLAKYGTDGASAILEKIADNLSDEDQSSHYRDICDCTREIASDLKKALQSHKRG